MLPKKFLIDCGKVSLEEINKYKLKSYSSEKVYTDHHNYILYPVQMGRFWDCVPHKLNLPIIPFEVFIKEKFLQETLKETFTIEGLKKAGKDIWVECTEEEAVKLTDLVNCSKGLYSSTGYSKVHIYITHDDWGFNPTDGEAQRGKKIIQFNQIKFPKMEEKRKIIGYKSPKDLFAGRVPAGTIYNDKTPDNYTYSWKGNLNSAFNMPIEIVEGWEPIYEEEFKVGDWVVASHGNVTWCENSKNIVGEVTTITDGPLYWKYRVKSESLLLLNKYGYNYAYFKEVRKATPEEIAAYKKSLSIKIGDYEAKIEDIGDKIVAFGCVKLSKEMLLAYLYLLDSEAKAEIKIRNTVITSEIINKLLKMIE